MLGACQLKKVHSNGGFNVLSFENALKEIAQSEEEVELEIDEMVLELYSDKAEYSRKSICKLVGWNYQKLYLWEKNDVPFLAKFPNLHKIGSKVFYSQRFAAVAFWYKACREAGVMPKHILPVLKDLLDESEENLESVTLPSSIKVKI